MLVQALAVWHKSCLPVCLQSLICHLDHPLHLASTSKRTGRRRFFFFKNFKAKLSGMRQLLQEADKAQPCSWGRYPQQSAHTALADSPQLTSSPSSLCPACPLDTVPAQLPPAARPGFTILTPPGPSEVWAAGQTRLMTCLGG